MSKHSTRFNIALALSFILNIIFIYIIFNWSYYPDNFHFLFSLVEILGIIVSVATYVTSKHKDEFNYTMKIITGIQSSIAEISSRNNFNEEFIKSRKNIVNKLSRISSTYVISKYKNELSNRDIKYIKDYATKNWINSHYNFINKRAKFRVISEIMVKLNQYSIYILKKQVDSKLVKSELKSSLTKFLNSNMKFFNNYIDRIDKGSVNLNNLSKLIHLWDISIK